MAQPSSIRSSQFLWNDLANKGRSIALIDAASGQELTYKELDAEVERLGDNLRAIPKAVVFLPLENVVEHVIRYLGVLRAGHVPLIYNPQMPLPAFLSLVEEYFPALVFGNPIILRTLGSE